MSDVLLQVRDLSVIYKTDLETVHAVNGISFSLERGKTLGLVGETGADQGTPVGGLHPVGRGQTLAQPLAGLLGGGSGEVAEHAADPLGGGGLVGLGVEDVLADPDLV